MKYTYKEAFDKITEAYIKGEIKPTDCEFCFCGTLNCGNSRWAWYQDKSFPYTYNEFERMENALLSDLANPTDPEYEESLFSRMCAALDVLKQIHIERGEIIDETSEFKKRELTHFK